MNTDPTEHSCFFTGHRFLPHERICSIRSEIKRLAIKMIEEKNVTRFLAGGAIGFDTLAEDVVLELKKKYAVKLYMYLPCADQHKLWNASQKAEYKRILSEADNITYATSGSYLTGCMQLRNKMLVRDAKYGIVYCTNKHSGTYSTVIHACAQGRTLYLINPNGGSSSQVATA